MSVHISLPRFFNRRPGAHSTRKIISGDAFTLSDGRTIRLEGIHAPFEETKALADQARDGAEKLTAGKTPELENASTDRYGRITAQVYVPQDGGKKLWIQGELLRAGLAFVYPPTGHEDNLGEMLKLETEARGAKRGIWADAAYGDTPIAETGKKYGQFAFVSGKVLKAERIKNKLYLNFGEDWHTDFTVTIAAHDLHNFRTADIDPLSYEGKTIRVRGWINRDFGPMITITHPGQIEIVGTR